MLNTYQAGDLTRILREYGEEKFARKIAARGRPRARAGAVHHLGPPRRAALRRDPGAGPAHRRAPGQAHLPGAADGGQRRARRAAPGDPGGDRRDRRRRPRGRGVLPLAGGPAGQAGLRRRHPHRRPGRPAVRARRATSRRSAWSPAAPRRPTPDEIAENPRAASVRLRAVERVRPTARASPASRPRRPRQPSDEQRPSRRSTQDPASTPARRRQRRRRGPGSPSCPASRARAPRVPFVTLVSLVLARRRRRAAPLQHLDAAGVVRDHRAGGAGRRSRRPRADAGRWSSSALRNPQRVAEQAQALGMVLPSAPCFLALSGKQPDCAAAPAARHAAAAAGGAGEARDPRPRADHRPRACGHRAGGQEVPRGQEEGEEPAGHGPASPGSGATRGTNGSTPDRGTTTRADR